MKMRRFLFAAGFLAVVLWAVPGWLLGENAIFTYHDQLDGEMIAYILQAKHLGAGQTFPEFMGGAAKTALIPPAPGCVLLFRLFEPLTALFIMQLAGSLIGYIGMYLLALKVAGNAPAALAAGGLYGILPFLPVYGLSQFGLPLLLWFVLGLREGRRRIPAFAYGILYALHSSLALVGFAVLLALAVWWIVAVLRRRAGGRANQSKEAACKSLPDIGGMWAGMAAAYVLTNLSLIGQLLGLNGGELSHKAEYVLAAEGFAGGWVKAFLHNGQHSEDYHIWFLAAAVAVLCVSWWYLRCDGKRTDKAAGQDAEKAGQDAANDFFRTNSRAIGVCLLCNACLSGVCACWNSGVGVLLRRKLGALGAFQLDRLLWLAPCLWYLMLACCVAQVIGFARQKRRILRLAGCLGCVLTAAAAGLTAFKILKDSDVKSNIQRLRNADYPAISYSDYYAIGVLEQVRDFLRAQTGQAQEDYRVVSLGIDPAAALYHGFYCLDGYSNNYSLEYKHRFRRIIAPALSQSEYLREYYDNWGNRCYIFGTESPGYYTIEKNGFYFRHLETDTKALRELGGDYLLSAAYIANSGELGLTLLREEPFETEDSYYRIFVYEVGQVAEGDAAG